MTVKEKLELKLKAAFSPLFLEVKDDSDRHAGHAGARLGGKSHFRIKIVSARFSGLTRLERHQKVYACLEAELKAGIHALSLKTLSPEDEGSGESM